MLARRTDPTLDTSIEDDLWILTVEQVLVIFKKDEVSSVITDSEELEPKDVMCRELVLEEFMRLREHETHMDDSFDSMIAVV